MIRYMRLAALSAAVVSAFTLSHRAAAQDIVMAGRVHGVELPASGRAILAKDPNAFEFRRAMKSKLRAAQLARGTRRGLLPSYEPNGGSAGGVAISGAAGATRVPHIGDGPVVNGTEKVVVLPILFSNT